MSTDEKVAKELVETLKDGERGYRTAGERLRENGHEQWAGTMERLAEQRATFTREIVEMGHDYGDEVDESGSTGAAVHRGWLSLKDAVTGDNASSVLGAAVSGEDHAVSEYEKALDEDLSGGFRNLVQRQHEAVVAARDEVTALRDAG